MDHFPRLVVFASGEGTNFQSIIDSVKSGFLKADILGLFTNRKNCRSVERAEVNGIAVKSFNWKKEEGHQYRDLLWNLEAISPDLIVLAGFMRILPASVIDSYPMKIINTHPSLLPCFGGMNLYGENVHRAVIESGARFSGCTVHFVTKEVDRGPIILQSVVPVSDDETVESLSTKLRDIEHDTFVRAISIVLSGKYTISGNRVRQN